VDFELTEEQRWLAESVGQLLSRESGDGVWRSLVEFGALEVGGGGDDDDDDEGLGVVELALVARTVGARLVAVAYAETAAAHAVADLGGRSVAACLSEPGRAFAPADTSTSVENGRVTGEKTGVAYGAKAELLAVPAVADGAVVLAIVPSERVTITPEPTLDEAVAPASVSFDGAQVERVISDRAAVDSFTAVGGVLVAAEAVGAAATIFELAREYASERRQFGRTIGTFQALRHLLADQYVQLESAWSSVLYAAASLDEREPDAARTASIAKAYATRATQSVGHGALQVFGGIAFTAEHQAHRYLRRIVVRGMHFGTARDHERILGRTLARTVEALA
jgi:alkylation response protein AidB-like acyl-CoA dehydrogenase